MLLMLIPGCRTLCLISNCCCLQIYVVVVSSSLLMLMMLIPGCWTSHIVVFYSYMLLLLFPVLCWCWWCWNLDAGHSMPRLILLFTVICSCCCLQFFADADDVDTWMLDTLRLVSYCCYLQFYVVVVVCSSLLMMLIPGCWTLCASSHIVVVVVCSSLLMLMMLIPGCWTLCASSLARMWARMKPVYRPSSRNTRSVLRYLLSSQGLPDLRMFLLVMAFICLLFEVVDVVFSRIGCQVWCCLIGDITYLLLLFEEEFWLI